MILRESDDSEIINKILLDSVGFCWILWDSDKILARVYEILWSCQPLTNVLSSVRGLTPSNENYVVLVDLLEERYGRKPKVIAAYMRALYNLQKAEANLKSLRGFYD